MAKPRLIANSDFVESELKTSTGQNVSLQRGQNAVTVDKSAPFNVLNIDGRTLVNLLGRDGNFENDSNGDGVADGWSPIAFGDTKSIDTTWGKYGTKAQRITSTASDTNILRRVQKLNIKSYAGKSYLVAVDFKKDANGIARLAAYYNSGNANVAQVSESTALEGLLYATYSPASDNAGDGLFQLYNVCALGVVGWVQYDGARFYEITATEKTYIDGLTVAQAQAYVTAKYPYVDDMKHLNGVYLMNQGEQDTSYVYYPDVQLKSNVDGSIVDKLYIDKDDKPRVTRQFKEMVLDGSLVWSFNADNTGFKLVTIPSSGLNIIGNDANSTLIGVKYDGKVLKRVALANIATDTVYVDGVNTAVAIADTDSGWGETYTPTSAEVQAYFWGWRMYDGTFGVSTPYNGTGSKWWVDNFGTLIVGGVNICPTTMAQGGYKPYRLNYQLAASVDEAVSYEGSIMIYDGTNQIEIGEGIVIREKVNPVSTGTGAYNINNWNPTAALRNRTAGIMSVYKNGVKDTKWKVNSFGATPNAVYGQYLATIMSYDYDPTAEYTVTYLILDKYAQTSNIVSLSATYNSTFKGIIGNINQELTDVTTKQSITEIRLDKTFIKGLGERVERGTVTLANPTVAGSPLTIGTVSFGKSFSSPPTVLINFLGSFSSLSSSTTLEAGSVTTTGFTIFMATGAVPTQTTTTYTWVAIGN